MAIHKLLLTALLGLAVSGGLQAQDSGKGHKIIFGFTRNDSMQIKAFLNQLSNVREEWPEAEIEVVAYNFGLDILFAQNNPWQKKIEELQRSGVRFVACGNTMARRKIQSSQILGMAEIVKAGITEIVLKQEAGWSYVVGGF